MKHAKYYPKQCTLNDDSDQKKQGRLTGKYGLSLLVGSTVSIAALYFAFRNIPFKDLLTYLLSINYFWIIPSIAVIMIVFSLRAVRWRYILASDHSVGYWQAFHPLMIGFMLNCILPGRVGEFARPVVLKGHEERYIGSLIKRMPFLIKKRFAIQPERRDPLAVVPVDLKGNFQKSGELR